MDEQSAASSVHLPPRIERTTSHSSLSSRFSLMRTPSKISSETQEAELIAQATSQAIIAAKSIIMSGGTQSTALPTAKAAALSILAPKSGSLVVGSSSANFLGRRKAKRQATIIASMAVGSVKNALQNQYSNRNSFDPNRGTDDGSSYQHWDATQILKGQGPSSLLAYDNDYLHQGGNASSRISSGPTNGNQGLLSSFGFPGSPQPSAVATTISGSQTTTHSSTIASFGTRERPRLDTPTSTLRAISDAEKSSQANRIADQFRDNEPTIANILTSLASLSDLGSNPSPKSIPSHRSSRTKALVDFLMKKDVLGDDSDCEDERPSAQAAVPHTGLEANDLSSGFPSAEDPIYVRVQKGDKTPESKPNQSTMRMEQFLQSSNSYDSNDDSYSGGSSAYESRDSTFHYTLRSGTGETGTVDSGTVESETLGSGTYNDTRTIMKDDDNHYFGNTASNVLSSISEAFFCSPVAVKPIHVESRDYSDEKDRGSVRDQSPRKTSSDVRIPKQRKSISSEEDTDDEDDHPVYNATEEARVTKLKAQDIDVKKSSIHESMEQLVLRALSATPAAASYSASPKSLPGNSKSGEYLQNSFPGDRMRPSAAESSFEGADSGSVSSKSAAPIVGRRIKFPNWVRNRKGAKAQNKDAE